ncbi:MAG: RNA-binding S4 domain-containing protein [Pseudomonadota bacterium]
MTTDHNAPENPIRIDKWLFFARIFKSRSLAAKAVSSGDVRLNGSKIDNAAKKVCAGNTLTINKDRRVLVFEIASVGSRRGPYEEAKQLYIDHSPPPPQRSTSAIDALPKNGSRMLGGGRPTKKERRQTDQLRGRLS